MFLNLNQLFATLFFKEILALAEHGCTVIQIDEPVLMRKPKEAIAYGIQDVVACMKGNISFAFVFNILAYDVIRYT